VCNLSFCCLRVPWFPIQGIIDDFPIAEMRATLDKQFDQLTTVLVACGQACLKRLARLVMIDIQNTLNEVFMPDWMEGNQMEVATATLSDYMADFQQFLVVFWSEKFIYTILEEVILSYVRIILFRKQAVAGAAAVAAAQASTGSSGQGQQPIIVSSPGGSSGMQQQQQQQQNSSAVLSPGGSDSKKGGFFTSLFKSSKEKVSGIIQEVKQVTVNAGVCAGLGQCDVDSEALGRLAQDVNTLNKFFSTKATQETATEFLQLVNEVSLMLFLDLESIFSHVDTRILEFPSSASVSKSWCYHCCCYGCVTTCTVCASV
jgi:hypothetical protein